MRYRRRPKTVEAIRWSPGVELPAWARLHCVEVTPDRLEVGTWSNTQLARPGDWIVREDMRGAVFTMNHDAFTKAYEPME